LRASESVHTIGLTLQNRLSAHRLEVTRCGQIQYHAAEEDHVQSSPHAPLDMYLHDPWLGWSARVSAVPVPRISLFSCAPPSYSLSTHVFRYSRTAGRLLWWEMELHHPNLNIFSAPRTTNLSRARKKMRQQDWREFYLGIFVEKVLPSSRVVRSGYPLNILMAAY